MNLVSDEPVLILLPVDLLNVKSAEKLVLWDALDVVQELLLGDIIEIVVYRCLLYTVYLKWLGRDDSVWKWSFSNLLWTLELICYHIVIFAETLSIPKLCDFELNILHHTRLSLEFSWFSKLLMIVVHSPLTTFLLDDVNVTDHLDSPIFDEPEIGTLVALML